MVLRTVIPAQMWDPVSWGTTRVPDPGGTAEAHAPVQLPPQNRRNGPKAVPWGGDTQWVSQQKS